MRHAGVLSSLVLTAALLCAMPGLLKMPAQPNRADESLRPAQLRTMTVWLMPGEVGDRKLLGRLCAAFEKEHDGVRVFLRVVTADEFDGETAVLPDVALFETGDAIAPEKVFLPIGDAQAPSGSHAGTAYAMPLWLAPNVLSIPQAWLQNAPSAVPRADSLLAAATAVPLQENSGLVEAENVPWSMLIQPGAVAKPSGVGWQQLLASCPGELRARLVAGVLGMPAGTPSPTGALVTTLPVSRGASPTPMPAITTQARVETLAQHQSRIQSGEAFSAFVLSPSVSLHVRYAALCRDGEDAQAFVQYLTNHRQEALSSGLIAPGCILSADPLTNALEQAYQSAVLPNAFAHTKSELLQLCADDFARCADPVGTLLRLR